MTSPRRFRFTLRRLMVTTALFAMVFAGVAWFLGRLAREREAVRLEFELHRLEERLKAALRMEEMGILSSDQVAFARVRRDRTRTTLQRLKATWP
jgi:type II secretory pathway component PulJ